MDSASTIFDLQFMRSALRSKLICIVSNKLKIYKHFPVPNVLRFSHLRGSLERYNDYTPKH